MKRTPLRPGPKSLTRKARLKSSAPPARRTRLARSPMDATRKPVKRFARRRDPKFCDWVRTFNCPFAWDRMRFEPKESALGWMLFHRDCLGPTEVAHIRTRAAGGDDKGNVIPLCRAHHREQHDKGIQTFQQLYGFDLQGLADKLARRWDALQQGDHT